MSPAGLCPHIQIATSTIQQDGMSSSDAEVSFGVQGTDCKSNSVCKNADIVVLQRSKLQDHHHSWQNEIGVVGNPHLGPASVASNSRTRCDTLPCPRW